MSLGRYDHDHHSDGESPHHRHVNFENLVMSEVDREIEWTTKHHHSPGRYGDYGFPRSERSEFDPHTHEHAHEMGPADIVALKPGTTASDLDVDTWVDSAVPHHLGGRKAVRFNTGVIELKAKRGYKSNDGLCSMYQEYNNVRHFATPHCETNGFTSIEGRSGRRRHPAGTLESLEEARSHQHHHHKHCTIL